MKGAAAHEDEVAARGVAGAVAALEHHPRLRGAWREHRDLGLVEAPRPRPHREQDAAAAGKGGRPDVGAFPVGHVGCGETHRPPAIFRELKEPTREGGHEGDRSLRAEGGRPRRKGQVQEDLG